MPESVINNGKQVVSEASFALATFVAVVAVVAVVANVAVAAFPVQLPDEPLTFPVTLPVTAPVKVVQLRLLVLELYLSAVLFLGCNDCVPESVTNRGKQVVSVVSSTV